MRNQFQLSMEFVSEDQPLKAETTLIHRAAEVMPHHLLSMEIIAAMSYAERTAYVLEHFPEARGNDCLCLLLYWWLWDSLDLILTDEEFAEMLAWTRHATTPETVRRRRQEFQRLRSTSGCLLPDEGTIARRRALDGAGSPDRWRQR